MGTNTLGALFNQAPQLQDKDLLNIRLLTFADINGQTYKVTPKQLKIILDRQTDTRESTILEMVKLFNLYEATIEDKNFNIRFEMHPSEYLHLPGFISFIERELNKDV